MSGRNDGKKSGNFFLLAIISLAILFIISCTSHGTGKASSQASAFSKYENPDFGFSVMYPSSWNQSAQKLSDKWGITDADNNAVLFMASPLTAGTNLSQLAMEQIKHDLGSGQLPPEQQIQKVIRIIDVGNITWYTYGLGYKDKNIESIVSGTICGSGEINIILVSNPSDYNRTRDVYTAIMQSYACSK